MKKVYKISKNGIINGLWDDMLSSIPGNKKITRASHVEFDEKEQRWYIDLIQKDRSLKRFSARFLERADAIKKEIEINNDLLRPPA